MKSKLKVISAREDSFIPKSRFSHSFDDNLLLREMNEGKLPGIFYNSLAPDIQKKHIGDILPDPFAAYFCRISAVVLSDRKIRPLDKLVYGIIETSIRFYNYVFFSKRYLAKILAVDEKSIQRSLSRLRKHGLVYSINRPGKSSIHLIANLDLFYSDIAGITPRDFGWKQMAKWLEELDGYYEHCEKGRI